MVLHEIGAVVGGVNVYRMIPERDLLINRMTFSAYVMDFAGTYLDLICGVVYGSDANGMPSNLMAATPPQDLAAPGYGGAFVGGERQFLTFDPPTRSDL